MKKEKEKPLKKSLCESCQYSKKKPLHTCPYAEACNGDDRHKMCNCCDDCRENCNQDT